FINLRRAPLQLLAAARVRENEILNLEVVHAQAEAGRALANLAEAQPVGEAIAGHRLQVHEQGIVEVGLLRIPTHLVAKLVRRLHRQQAAAVLQYAGKTFAGDGKLRDARSGSRPERLDLGQGSLGQTRLSGLAGDIATRPFADLAGGQGALGESGRAEMG